MIHAQHKPISNEQREKQRSLAIAALTQATYLVESIAQEGKCDPVQFNVSMDALLDKNYMGNREFSIGRNKAKQLLQGHEITYAKKILAHTASLISIEKKLSKQPDTLKHIAQGMERIQKQSHFFGNPYHENIISGIAHLYGETISNIQPRIIIRGKPEFLKQKHHTEQVRCLLFSGIRAACVWRTHGGNPMRLIFGRRNIITHLETPEYHT